MHPFRDTELSRHHLINKIHNGKTRPNNILMLWRDKHSCLHEIFGNKSLRDIILDWNMYKKYTQKWQWKLLFKDNDFEYCKKILQRVNRIKRKQPKHY